MKFSNIIALLATAAASPEAQTTVSTKHSSFLSQDNQAEIN